MTKNEAGEEDNEDGEEDNEDGEEDNEDGEEDNEDGEEDDEDGGEEDDQEDGEDMTRTVRTRTTRPTSTYPKSRPLAPVSIFRDASSMYSGRCHGTYSTCFPNTHATSSRIPFRALPQRHAQVTLSQYIMRASPPVLWFPSLRFP